MNPEPGDPTFGLDPETVERLTKHRGLQDYLSAEIFAPHELDALRFLSWRVTHGQLVGDTAPDPEDL